ncbi:hypothetical protein MD484_g1554, partial [Candolleomyces efflorescens]
MATSSAFGENVDLLGSIRSILDNYPFSAGLLREILQNSDDAKATTQTFLLDCRKHPSESICDPRIADTQGPALLAFNDANFLPEDWAALQMISKSSKRDDTSKIGKFGIGIRSCYHVTDFLQILSGEYLVIFDPQSSFSIPGGERYSFSPDTIEPIRDHFQAFEHFLPSEWNGEAFDGTIVRLPLRTEPGELREKIVSSDEIKLLFQEFIDKELNIAMLFLQHLRSINFVVIDKAGKAEKLAHSTVPIADRLADGVYKQLVTFQLGEATASREEWLVMQRSSTKEDALKLLSDRTGSESVSERVLKKHKLRADVGLAFPLSSTHDVEPDIGHLFTFLRLPIKTGFPAHIHSLFSLTPSRQNLRPHGENGIVKGSDDHILIEWNKLLFDVFIPRAWLQLLKTITVHFPTTDIFSAWPVTKHFTESDSAYWASFSKNVLDKVVENHAAVWPVVNQDVHEQLKDVFVAGPGTSKDVIHALADTGMKICHPPDHLFRMIEALPEGKRCVLTAECASTELRASLTSNLIGAPAGRRVTILQYLLSTNNIVNIAGLEIVPTGSGNFVSLVERGATPNSYTLLEKADVELFLPCDGDAIVISRLPPSTLDVFIRDAPRVLNVKWLDSDQVVGYLALHPTRHGIELSQTKVERLAVAFLSTFWAWLGCWGGREQLLPKLSSQYVLPCAGGKLRRAIQPVFESTDIPDLTALLSELGVPFLSDALERKAQAVLKNCGFLKSTTEIHALLDAVTAVGRILPDQSAQLLLDHFKKYMVNSTQHPFSSTQMTTFKQLHIFPIVEYDANAGVRRRRSAVGGVSVYGVTSFGLLPVLPNAVFVDLNVLSDRLLPFLSEAHSSPLSTWDVLRLSVKRLDQQRKKHLAHMLQRIANDPSGLTFSLKQSLSSEMYAYSSLGTRKAPQTLIDPSSPLYPLYVNDQERLHGSRDTEEGSIASSLAQLGLLDKALSATNIIDRIQHIDSTASLEDATKLDAIKLLNIIYRYGVNCHSLTVARSLQWLPTQKGTLASAAECRPGTGATSEELHLFDKVLDLVYSNAMISTSLRSALGWDDPISIDVLLKQFREVLDNPEHDVYNRVKNIIKELSSRRDLTGAQWNVLYRQLENRKWVPTSDHTLAEPWQVVFSSWFRGIYKVAPDLGRTGSESYDFLMKLGCLASPSFATVTKQLSRLKTERPSASVTSSAIATLKFAVSLNLNEDQRSQLLVPDDVHQLQPIQNVLFNDVGANSLLRPRSEVRLASSSIDDDLAMALKIKRLGHEHVHLRTLGEDMGISPATIVEKTLAQYTEKQFLPEFLANAQDAGASKFVIMINDYTSAEGNFLSPALRTLCSGRSIMIYNDSEFSDQDFEGICKSYIGSKGDNPDSIGQFGLGALTMFHITECATIFSGDQVLFLDPSKSYLPIAGRASLLMPLKDLAFIEARLRTSACSQSQLWSLMARRTEGPFDGFIETKIYIDSFPAPPQTTSSPSEWLTMSSVFEASDVPLEYEPGTGPKKLRVGLAARLCDRHPSQSRFFAMLPLAISTTLPVHVNASFRMSSDRRQIRLDSHDRDNTRFNRWLLETQIPPLYLALLERIAQERDNASWWPGARMGVASPADEDEDSITTAQEDALTSVVTKSFYSTHLPASSRSILRSMYTDESFGTSDVILYSTKPPPSVQRLLDILQPKHVTKPTTSVRSLLKQAGLAIVGPSFVSQLLGSGGAERIRKHLGGLDELKSLLIWLSEESGDRIRGLPLLYLEDKTWATFQTGGQVYYRSPSSSKLAKDGILPAGRFVHLDIMPKTLLKTLSASAIRVAALDAAGVRQLVEEKLKVLEPQRKAAWVKRFWKIFPTFQRDGLQVLKSIETLALVPTLSETGFKSLLECKRNGMFTDLIDVFDDGWLQECFKDLGVDVVPLDRLPPALREVLRSQDYSLPGSQITRFLCCISPIISSAVRSFTSWPLDRRNKFSKWVRERINGQIPRHLIHTVSQLPVWPAQRGIDVSLCSAREVTLLPDGISMDAGRFCSSFMTAEGGVSHLGVGKQTLTKLLQSLDLPPILPEGRDEEIYRGLLDHLISPGNRNTGEILVPNTSRVMVNCHTLFERTDFFLAAFGEASDRFLLRTFISSEHWLKSRGLKCMADLDIDLFSLCVRAFQGQCNDTLQDEGTLDPGLLRRAKIIYRAYCESLPVQVSTAEAEQWHTLGNLRFIPRKMDEVRRYASQAVELPEPIRSLPRLVSPNTVVRSRFHNIAWTQRVALEQEPNARLLVAFPDFGKPSLKEVVAHLKELVKISLSHESVVLPDLKATYKWLNDQNTSSFQAQSLTPELQDSPMFLNVDDPDSEPWKWLSARQMAFETHNVGNIEGVGKFLTPFSNLLKAAGVLEACYPKLEAVSSANAPNDRDLLKQYRDGFSRLRETGRFVDVAFVPQVKDSSPDITDACLPLLRGHRSFLSVCNSQFEELLSGDHEDAPDDGGGDEDALEEGAVDGVFLSEDGALDLGTPEDDEDEANAVDEADGDDEADVVDGGTSEDGVAKIYLSASSFAIKSALDYLYVGQALDKEVTLQLEDLLQTLELSGRLEIDGLFHQAQREVVERQLVDPLNLSDVQTRAKAVGANSLTEWCHLYETRNRDLIRLAVEGNAAALN